MASTVGKAVCDGTRISSPGFTPSARNVSQRAAVPELVRTPWATPASAASSRSSAWHSGPRMYCRDSTAARTARRISSSTGGRDKGTDVTRRPAIRGRRSHVGPVQAAVATPVVQQGMTVSRACALHSPHENGVISRLMHADGGALEVGVGLLDDGHLVLGDQILDALELVLDARGGEAARQLLLVGVQDVDGEVPRVAEGGEALGLVVHTDQDERRIEGDRGERARRQAGGPALGVERGHHGDARGEMAENVSKFVWRNHRSYVAGEARECNRLPSLRASGGRRML